MTQPKNPFSASISEHARERVSDMHRLPMRWNIQTRLGMHCALAVLEEAPFSRSFRTAEFAADVGVTQTTLYTHLGKPLDQGIVKRGIEVIDKELLDPRHKFMLGVAIGAMGRVGTVDQALALFGSEYVRTMNPNSVMAFHKLARTQESTQLFYDEVDFLNGLINVISVHGRDRKRLTPLDTTPYVTAVACDAAMLPEQFGQYLAGKTSANT